MKKTVALCVCLVLIFSSVFVSDFSVPAMGTELYSCGFESGQETEFVTDSTCANSISSENAHSGSYCLALTPSASDQKLYRENIAVDSGKDYTVSFWYRGKPNWAYVRVAFESDVDTQMYFIKSDDVLNEWAYGEMRFNTGKYDSIDLIFGTSGTGCNFFLDDITIAESTAIVTDPDNIFPDGSFESGSLENWEIISGVATISNFNPQTGSYSMKMNAKGSNYGYPRAMRTVTVAPNTDYTFSFWYCGSAGYQQIVIRDTNNKDLEDTDYWKICYETDFTATRKFYSYTFNSGNNTQLKLGVRSAAARDFYIDDICLKKATPSEEAAGELLDNGGFENNGADWYIEPTKRVFETDDPHSGVKAFYIQPDQSYQLVTKKVTVKKNTDYTYSFWYRGTPGWAQYYVRDAGGAKDAVAKAVFFGSGDEVAEWTQVVVPFNSGSYTEYKVGVMTSGPSYPFWLDDVSVVEGIVTPDDDDKSEGELLDNGGFENKGTDWYIEPTKRIYETDNPHGGEKAFYIQPDQSYQLVTKKVTVKKNTDYTYSFWYRGTPGWAQYYVRDAGGAKDAVAKAVFFGSGDEVAEWTQVFVPFNSGNYTEYKVGVMTSGPSYPFWLDDVSVVEGIIAPPEDTGPIVENGGFEKNGDGWYIEPTGRVFDTDDAHGGKKAFYIQPDQSYQLILRSVKLKKDTDYTFGFWYRGTPGWAQYVIRNGNGTVAKEVFLGSGNEVTKWTYFGVSFHTGDETAYRVGVMTSGPSYPFWWDDVTVVEGIVETPSEPTEPDEPEFTASVPTLVEDMPMYVPGTWIKSKYVSPEDKNLLADSGFEADGGSAFDKYVSVTDEAYGVHSGKKAAKLLVTGEGTAILPMNVEKNTEYLFGMWIRCRQYAPDNTNEINWGISAPGSKELALRKSIPAGDGVWHLVEYTFNSQDNEQVALNIIAKETSMYFDDMFLCRVSDMVQYTAPEEALAPAEASGQAPSLTGCDEKDNLFENYDLSDKTDSFWSDVNGSVWGKQLTVEETGSAAYGKALHYRVGKDSKGRDRLTGAYYIRRVAVEPDTEYTFSAAYSLVKPSVDNGAGATVFGLIDTNREAPSLIHGFTLDKSVYREDHGWQTAAVTFRTGDYHEIAFVVLDCGGEAYLDDLRLFKSENAVQAEQKSDDFSAKKLTSKKYTVQDGVVPGVPEGTTADKLIGAFDHSEYLAVYDAQGDRASGNTPLATGMELRLMNGPVIIDRALISVRGDVDGNGTADEKDVQKVQAMLTGEETLTGVALRAADYDGSGTVDICDTLHKERTPKSGGSMSASVVPPENPTANSAFEVCLRVKGGVSAVSGSIRYDKAHMILRDVSLCMDSPWMLTYSYGENEVLFAVTNCGGGASPTETSLLKLTFETDKVGDGLPAVTFTNLKLTDGSNVMTPADAAWTYSEPKKAQEKAPSSSAQQQTDTPEQQVTTIVTTGLDEADNNYLESLVVDEAEISPKFDPENKNYTADVPFEVKQVTVTAVPQSERATVTISDTELPFVGKNIVKVVVHSESGLKRTYKVYITRHDKTRAGQEDSSSFPWWIVIAAGAVVLAGGIFLLIFFKKKKKKEENG